MEPANLQRRSEIARRLKAARWIRGPVVAAEGKNGKKHKVGWKVRELYPDELVAREPLAGNGWTDDRIGAIERMERHTHPLELQALEMALDLPDLFADLDDPATRFVDAALWAARQRGEHSEPGPEAQGDEGAPGGQP